MSYLGSFVGATGSQGRAAGSAGTNYEAQGVPIQMPVSTAQAQSGLAQQQAFLTALAGQNGIQNQSNVYNQLAGVASGTGANPAKAMLQQATNENIANQAAMQASQRGASANPALIARLAAQQGAGIQQNAAGQAATMQANQQLGALGQMGGIAGQEVQNQAGNIQAYNSNLLGSIAAQNQANVNMQSNINNANAGIANTVAGKQMDFGSGAVQGLGAGLMMADGGEISKYPDGGIVAAPVVSDPSLAQPQSSFAKFLSNWGNPDSESASSKKSDNPEQQGGYSFGKGAATALSALFANGGKVPAMVSPGERYLRPQAAQEVAKGQANPKAVSEKIPGKAKVKGDSYANDTVKKTLDAGGVVVPRSKAESDAKTIAKFVVQALAKHGHLPKNKKK